MRTMRLALSFVAIATQGVFAKEMAIVNCNDSFLIIQQDITEQGMRVFRCGGQGPACITSDDCQVGTCAPELAFLIAPDRSKSYSSTDIS